MPWDYDNRGALIAPPLVGYETEVVAKTYCGLRLVLARPEDPPGTGSMAVQLKMTVSEAESLVKDLRKLVAEVLLRRSISNNVKREQEGTFTKLARGMASQLGATNADDNVTE
jgi:hypothetical protein